MTSTSPTRGEIKLNLEQKRYIIRKLHATFMDRATMLNKVLTIGGAVNALCKFEDKAKACFQQAATKSHVSVFLSETIKYEKQTMMVLNSIMSNIKEFSQQIVEPDFYHPIMEELLILNANRASSRTVQNISNSDIIELLTELDWLDDIQKLQLIGPTTMTKLAADIEVVKAMIKKKPKCLLTVESIFKGVASTDVIITSTTNQPNPTISTETSTSETSTSESSLTGTKRLSSNTPSKNEPTAKVSKPQPTLCRNWQEGSTCYFGANCRFLHNDIYPRITPTHTYTQPIHTSPHYSPYGYTLVPPLSFPLQPQPQQ